MQPLLPQLSSITRFFYCFCSCQVGDGPFRCVLFNVFIYLSCPWLNTPAATQNARQHITWLVVIKLVLFVLNRGQLGHGDVSNGYSLPRRVEHLAGLRVAKVRMADRVCFDDY